MYPDNGNKGASNSPVRSAIQENVQPTLLDTTTRAVKGSGKSFRGENKGEGRQLQV
jgi:hypothetical protein